MERSIQNEAVESLLCIAARAGVLNYARIALPYTRCDDARNTITRAFMDQTSQPDDTLVMLDADHEHPKTIIERLVSHNLPVVGALAFTRLPPHRPCVAFRHNGQMAYPTEWEPYDGPVQVTIVGSGAIAIQRRVFETLQTHGYCWPWFRLVYDENEVTQEGEEVYFGRTCEKAGVSVYCDMGMVTPHLGLQRVDETTHKEYRARHSMAWEVPQSLKEHIEQLAGLCIPAAQEV
jgi:hypothetical protein